MFPFHYVFSLFVGVLCSPSAYTVFPDEVEAQFVNIDRSLHDFLERTDITMIALPFLRSTQRATIQDMTQAATREVEDSMSNIRALIAKEDPQFPLVLTRLLDILNRNLWHAASNIEDREAALLKARAHLEFIEARMEALERTAAHYGTYLLIKCGVIEFMSSLGGANIVSNERSEALEMLSMDIDDLIFKSPIFFLESSIFNGDDFSTSFGNHLFSVNYFWKMRRVGTQIAAGHFDPSLPSWSAFYLIGESHIPPTVPEITAATGSRMTLEQSRYSEELRSVYDQGMLFDTLFASLLREMANDEALSCVICMEDIGRVHSRVNPCLHSFHRQCLLRWLLDHEDCPVCRRPASTIFVYS